MEYDLQRFLNAQQPVYQQVITELKSGHKQSHWMWYIFPQLAGLGHSSTAQYFAINSLDEARAYLHDPVLGKRYIECIDILLNQEGRTAEQIFGYPDVLKLHSSVTLFNEAERCEEFSAILQKYYQGEPDRATLKILYPATAND